MSDIAVSHGMAASYEPSLFGTYSKKIGMWLFLLSDTLTFGALLFAYSYGRISNPDWPTPFHKESITNATIMTGCLLSSSLTMVLAVMAARRDDRSWTRNWILFTMLFGTAFIVLHSMEWTKLIAEGMTPSKNPWSATVQQFGGTFYTLTGMHMMHVTIGVIYLGVVALRKKFLPILLICWLAAWLGTPADSVFHTGRARAADRGHRRGRDPVSQAQRLRRARRGNRRAVLALRGSGVDVHFPAGVSDVHADYRIVSRLRGV